MDFGFTMAEKRIKTTVFWTCTLLISLLVECNHAQKLNIRWGPQSMMYLKGKYGRRYAPDNENSVLEGLKGWYTAIRGFQRLRSLLRSLETNKPSSKVLSSEKLFIHYLLERR